MGKIVKSYENKIKPFANLSVVLDDTLNLCLNWLNDVKENEDLSRINNAIHHRLFGYSGHMFYINTILNAINNYYTNKKKSKYITNFISYSFVYLEFVRSLFESDVKIIGEFNLIKGNYITKLEKADYLFIVSMENYLLPLIPVTEKLMVMGKKICIVTIKEAKKWALMHKITSNVSILYFEDIITTMEWETYQNSIRENNLEWSSIKKIIKKNVYEQNKYAYIALKRRLKVLFCFMLARTNLYYSVFDRIIEAVAPDKVICVRLRRAFDISGIQIAKSKNISTAMIIHGQISSSPLFYDSDGYFDVDCIYTWGKLQQDIIQSKTKYLGVGECRNYGNPYWDKLYLASRNINGSLNIRKLLFPEKIKYILLYLGQADSFHFFASFIKSFEATDDLGIIVKPHPYENSDKYSKILNKSNISFKIITDEYELSDIINVCDIAYTYTSTTGINVILENKPLIILNFQHEKGIFFCGDSTDIVITENPEEMKNFTIKLLTDTEFSNTIIKAQSNFIKDRIVCNGNATINIVNDLIYN